MHLGMVLQTGVSRFDSCHIIIGIRSHPSNSSSGCSRMRRILPPSTRCRMLSSTWNLTVSQRSSGWPPFAWSTLGQRLGSKLSQPLSPSRCPGGKTYVNAPSLRRSTASNRSRWILMAAPAWSTPTKPGRREHLKEAGLWSRPSSAFTWSTSQEWSRDTLWYHHPMEAASCRQDRSSALICGSAGFPFKLDQRTPQT